MKSYKLSQIPHRVLGRYSEEESLELHWGASAVEVCVRAKEVWVKLSADYDNFEPWVAVEVNGAPVSRFMVEKGEPRWVCVARNMNPQKDNLISIIKDTQAMPEDSKHVLIVHEVGVEGEFVEVPERSCKIEFIGDSITSGEGLAGKPDEMDWITQWFCASKTYAMRTAHAVNADWSVISQCGWGLCWGWDGNKNSRLPPLYEKWTYKGGADFVVLNLGTNDETGLPINKDEKIIILETANFLKTIRQNNPNAKIIWTWGMIKLNLVPSLIAQGIELYRKETGDESVFTLEFDSMQDVEKSDEDRGSRGHPGPKTHALAAQKLTDFIRALQN